MRFVVFLLGFLAALLTATVGGALLFYGVALDWLNTNVMPLESFGLDASATLSMTGITHANTGLVVLVAAAYGLLGAIFVLFRCGKQGGSLMLLPVLGAAFMNPITLVFTSFQALVGLTCFFIRPLPLNPPKAKDDEEDDDIEDDDD